MTTGTRTAGERYDFLDWLRVIAIGVLLFYHTGMLFVGWGWHVTNRETIPALQWPMDIAHRLRMPLLFVIAGAGMWFALRRRTGGGLLRERTVRLLLPLIVGCFVIVPPQIYFERLFHGQWSGGYLDFYAERVLQLQPYPAGNFSWHHLWFIAYLYVYALLLIPAMLWWKRRAAAPRPGWWLVALALPLGVNETLLKPLFGERHTLLNDWYIFDHYLLLTAYGYLLASLPGGWQWLAERRAALVFGGVATAAALIAMLVFGTVPHGGAVDCVLANVFTWLLVLAFLGYGRRYLSFANPLLRWARDASYPIYILHQTAIVALGYYVIQTSWTPWTKYWVVLSATLVACVVLYEYAVRRVSLLRVAFGMKGAPKTPPLVSDTAGV
ncbi:MAG TPA: acyltransferase family protein [Gammaproteobacteria bacterium]|nr:acyltransferase family protein [Gammaproteobacteria bacterium]